MKLSRADIGVLIALPLIALAFSLFLRSPYHITSTLLFYGLPTLYVFIRFRGYSSVLRDLLFIVIVSTPFAIIVDYIGIMSGLWFDPQVVFTDKLLGVVPLEDIIWMYAAVYLIIILYRTFFDSENKKLVHPRMALFAVPAALVLGAFFFLAPAYSSYFSWDGPFAYLKLGMIFLIPAAIFMIRFPRFLKKSFWITAYFFYATLLLEQTASHLHQWIFAGTYLTTPFSLFGYGFAAVEELFFVGIVGPFAVVAFYEFFDNNPA